MEQRQRRHEAVARREVGDGANLFYVGQQAGVRMHHALGVAFGTGSEQDQRRVLRALRQRRALRLQQMPQNPQLVRQRDGILQIFQIHPVSLRHLLRQVGQLALFQKLARGDDGLDAGGEHRAVQAVGAGGVVEHRRDAVTQRSAEDRRRGDGGVRQQQPDVFPFGGKALQNAADAQRFLDQRLITVFFESDVFDTGLSATVAVLRRQQGMEQRLRFARIHPRPHHDLHQPIARQRSAFTRARRFRHRQRGRRQDADADSREPADFEYPGHAAERAEFKPVDPHRHHGGARFGGDKRRAVVDFHQRAGHGDAPFREHHDRPPLLNHPHQLFDGHRLGGIERDEIDVGPQPAHKPALADAGVNRKHRFNRQEQRQQHAVEERDVVRCNQQFLPLEVLDVPFDPNPKQQAKQRAQQ